MYQMLLKQMILKLLRNGFIKTLKNKLKTFWKDFREVIANLICIPFLLTTIIVVMLTVGVCKLTDTILQIDRDVKKIFEECIWSRRRNREK